MCDWFVWAHNDPITHKIQDLAPCNNQVYHENHPEVQQRGNNLSFYLNKVSSKSSLNGLWKNLTYEKIAFICLHLPWVLSIDR